MMDTMMSVCPGASKVLGQSKDKKVNKKRGALNKCSMIQEYICSDVLNFAVIWIKFWFYQEGRK